MSEKFDDNEFSPLLQELVIETLSRMSPDEVAALVNEIIEKIELSSYTDAPSITDPRHPMTH